jgi:hypothetical protein
MTDAAKKNGATRSGIGAFARFEIVTAVDLAQDVPTVIAIRPSK